MKPAILLLLSLLIPQTFMGLYTVKEYSPAMSSEMAIHDPQTLVVAGVKPDVEKVNWFLDIQYPVNDYENTTSGFGYRSIEGCSRCSEFHRGVDFTPGRGENVYSIMDGVISQVQYSGEYGMHVIITHKLSEDMVYTTVYAHLQIKEVTKRLRLGNDINKGDLLGFVGNTGLSTGPHLHFEVLFNDKNLDPAEFFRYHLK